MKWIMTHELGHCIGFCHSDTQDGIAAYTLSSAACNSGFDAASVMICGCNVTSVPFWGTTAGTSNFSYCDKEVFNLKY